MGHGQLIPDRLRPQDSGRRAGVHFRYLRSSAQAVMFPMSWGVIRSVHWTSREASRQPRARIESTSRPAVFDSAVDPISFVYDTVRVDITLESDEPVPAKEASRGQVKLRFR